MVRIKDLAQLYQGKEELHFIKRTTPSGPPLYIPNKKPKLADDEKEEQTLACFLLNAKIPGHGSDDDEDDDDDESDKYCRCDGTLYDSGKSDGNNTDDPSNSCEARRYRSSVYVVPPSPHLTVSRSLFRKAQAAAKGVTATTSITAKVSEDVTPPQQSQQSSSGSASDSESSETSKPADDSIEVEFVNEGTGHPKKHQQSRQSNDEDDNGVYDDDNDDKEDNDSDPDAIEELNQPLTEVKVKKQKKDRAKWYLAFLENLQDLDGKALTPKHATQHTRQVILLHEAIDPKSDNLDVLPKEKGKKRWQSVKPLLDDGKTWDAIISHHNSEIL